MFYLKVYYIKYNHKTTFRVNTKINGMPCFLKDHAKLIKGLNITQLVAQLNKIVINIIIRHSIFILDNKNY